MDAKGISELRDALDKATTRWLVAKANENDARAAFNEARSLLNREETETMNARIAVDKAREALDAACGVTPPRPAVVERIVYRDRAPVGEVSLPDAAPNAVVSDDGVEWVKR